MKITEFHTASPAVKFTDIGDRIEGVIVEEPELQPDKYGDGNGKVLVLTIRDEDNVNRRLYARKHMLNVIGQAVAATGADEIECGGRLCVEYVDDKWTGGTAAMKVYEAQYAPPSPLGAGTLSADAEALGF